MSRPPVRFEPTPPGDIGFGLALFVLKTIGCTGHIADNGSPFTELVCDAGTAYRHDSLHKIISKATKEFTQLV